MIKRKCESEGESLGAIRPRRVFSCKMRQFVREDRAEFGDRKRDHEGKADDQRATALPDGHGAAGEVRDPDLLGSAAPGAAGDLVDDAEKTWSVAVE